MDHGKRGNSKHYRRNTGRRRRKAIESNMDMDRYENSIRRVETDAKELQRLREQLVQELGF